VTREAGKLGDIVKMIGLAMVAALGASETDVVVVRRGVVNSWCWKATRWTEITLNLDG
jgi:hypothetical protein